MLSPHRVIRIFKDFCFPFLSFFFFFFFYFRGLWSDLRVCVAVLLYSYTVRRGRWLCLEGLEADLSYKSHRPLSYAINSCHVTVDIIVSLVNKITLSFENNPVNEAITNMSSTSRAAEIRNAAQDRSHWRKLVTDCFAAERCFSCVI